MPQLATKQPDAPKTGIRGKRRVAGINASLAVLIAFAVLVVSNIASSRLYMHQHFDNTVAGGLSADTQEILKNFQGEIRMTSIFESTHPYRRAARALLLEYAEASTLVPGLQITTRSIDANHDMVAVSEMMHKFNPEINSIIVEYGSEHRIVSEFDMTAPSEEPTWTGGSSPAGDASHFMGERACTAAIAQLLNPVDSTVYFLGGHGEYDVTSHHHITGASSIAQAMMANGLSVKPLYLAQTQRIPDDCDALVVAGPRTMLTQREVEQVSSYLSDGGKAIMLIDHAYAGGLASILENWGIKILPPRQDAAPRNYVSTTAYGEHPVTRRMNNIMTVFSLPCSFETASADPVSERADKPKITPLVMIPANGMMPSSSEGAQCTPIALACELGGVALTGRRHNTKLVVIGDSEFISNAMSQANLEGNTMLFLSSVEWLLDMRNQPVLYADAGTTLNPGIDPAAGWQYLVVVVALLIPSAILAAGLFLIMPLMRRM